MVFFSLLGKDNLHNLDLSLLIQYPPQKVLFYFYNSQINISLPVYQELQNGATANDFAANSHQNAWLDLISSIGAVSDPDMLSDNIYLDKIGPYYCPEYNIRWYFTRKTASSSESLTAEDFAIINILDNSPHVDRSLQTYNKSRKSVKKTAKNKDDLLRDIKMCMVSLREIELLNKHINYLNKLIDHFYTIVNNPDFRLTEPDLVPRKPERPEDNNHLRSKVIPFARQFASKYHKTEIDNYKHELKIYYIQSKEYEKALERYKTALGEWDQYKQSFIEKCRQNISVLEEKLCSAESILSVYDNILLKSFVHPQYHHAKILETFKTYLETGRSHDIQECMNLFEEERLWNEIRAGQQRIENTIYFLQNDNGQIRLAEEHLNHLLKVESKAPLDVDASQ